MSSKEHLIFLSYAREDKEAVDEIYRQLRGAGLNPWMDDPPVPFHTEGIPLGADWDATIRDKMSHAEILFACFSNHAIGKPGYFQRECKIAVDRLNELPPGHDFLVAVLLEECTPQDIRIDTQSLNSRHWFRYYRDGIEPLIELGKSKQSGLSLIDAKQVLTTSPFLADTTVKAASATLRKLDVEISEAVKATTDEINKLASAMTEWSAKLNALPRSAKRAAKPVWRDAATTMSSFSNFIKSQVVRLRQIDGAMTGAFGHGIAAMSDWDYATPAIFDEKIIDVRTRQAIAGQLLDLVLNQDT